MSDEHIDDQTLANIMNKRHRSAKSQFKNPPQPKFCIKEKTLDGREIFINILSYSRIANQLSEFDPIPLYGGMPIRSYSSIKNSAHIQKPTSPSQLIFAVMASPEVLKKTGRGCADNSEQMNLVELMCEFVEAMNPGIVLSKQPEILKDKDLHGELKDVWSAVQNFRDKEKAGISDIVVYTEFGPDSASESIMKSVYRNDLCRIPLESHEIHTMDKQSGNSNYADKDKKTDDKKVSTESEKCVIDSDSLTEEVEKLVFDEKKAEKQHENHHKSEEKRNQKNKESQHHFFPKFLSSSKDKETKEKEKDDQEPKSKAKKSLNFFRRGKSSVSSPTHTSNNLMSANHKDDADMEE